MSKTIWKYPITGSRVELPVGAVPLSVQMQYGYPQFWALVDPEAPKEKVLLYFVGTGHPVEEEPGAYVGTFQLHGGA